jgi:DNA repair exonuclease SbcCD ATPase subunit
MKYQSLDTRKSTLGIEIEKVKRTIKTLESGICPTCKQKLPKNDKALNESTNELEELKKELSQIEITSIEKLIKENNSDLERMKKDDLTSKVEDLRREVRQKEMLERNIETEKNNLKRILNTTNPYLMQEKLNIEELKSLKEEEKKLNENIQKQKDLSQYYLFWEKGFGPRGIKNFIFDETIFSLSRIAQEYLDEISQGSIQIKFDPRKQKKNSDAFIETISLEISQRGNPREFLTWSSSERKRVSLAVNLAMNRLLSEMFGSNLGFIVLDEVFDSLDSVGIETFCSLLKKESKRIPQIFVISHADSLPDIFDCEIVVTKENGVSRIENSENRKLLEMSLPKVTLDKSMGKLKRRIK